MRRALQEMISLGGLIGCCAASVQLSQLVDGRAAPELFNYAVAAATAMTGLGLSVVSWRQRARGGAFASEDRAIVRALDRLFAHFPDDSAAQEAVRVVARAVTERRYRGTKG
jgi:hypothetical protein